MNSSIDILAIGAHPDDVEISCAGILLREKTQGKTTGILDLTQGEFGSRGDIQTRKLEAERASKVLNLDSRTMLDIKDGSIGKESSDETKIVQAIRQIRPDIVLFPPPFERHPDHEATHKLVRSAIFKSGLTKYQTEIDGSKQTPFRPRRIFSYMQSYEFTPDFYIDITPHFEKKIESIRCYRSQVFTGEAEDGAKTFVSSAEFMRLIEYRAGYFGSLIGVKYAEALMKIEPLGLSGLHSIL